MEPAPAEPPYELPRDLYYQIVHALRASLPRPVTGAPEDVHRRDRAAIAQVASLIPANGDEVNLAAQYVAASAHALDCLRLVQAYAADPAMLLKCQAQAASMMRQARSARALLLAIQAHRRKRDADEAASTSAAWTEHCTIGLLTDGLQERVAPVPASVPQPAAPPLPVLRPPAPPPSGTPSVLTSLGPMPPLPNLPAVTAEAETTPDGNQTA